jgi:hypothetical protein
MTMAKLIVLPQSWGTRYWFYCHGCRSGHAFHVRIDGGEPSWTFNGDTEQPTFHPSLKISGTATPTEDDLVKILSGTPVEPVPTLCHLFVENGKIRFLDDCTHPLRGQTVDMDTE